MTQHFPLDDGDPVHEGFFDPIQELLGAAAPSFRLRVASSGTAVEVPAGSGNDQAAIAIDGLYRYNTSTVTASLGAISSGTASIYATASANDFSGTPDPDSPTVYTFGLELKSSGTPTTAAYRKVGEVDVSGSAIVALRATVGSVTRSDLPIFATSNQAAQVALTARGASSQTADLFQVQTDTGTNVLNVEADGDTTLTGGLTISDTDGLVLSGNGGNDTINLSNTTAGVGLTIGGDVTLYRQAANNLQTDDLLTVSRASTSTAAVGTLVAGDSDRRLTITADGSASWGSGSASADVRIRRSAANTLTIDDGSSGGDAHLKVEGYFAANGATPAAAPTYTITDTSPTAFDSGDRDTSLDIDSTTLNEVAQVLATVIYDLKQVGIFA